MEWRDIGRYLAYLILFCVLDIVSLVIWGHQPDYDRNCLLAGGFTLLCAIREDRK